MAEVDGKERRQIMDLTYSAHGFGLQARLYYSRYYFRTKVLSLDLPTMILIA